MTAREVIGRLGLVPLPREGGYFRETWRLASARGSGAPGAKPAATAIYYLLTPDTVSALHRLPDDEIFHFYAGDPVEMLQLLPGGTARRLILGADLSRGQSPQVVVPRDSWQGCRLVRGGAWALLGSTMAPSFDPAAYEHGDRAALVLDHPAEADLIRVLTPD